METPQKYYCYIRQLDNKSTTLDKASKICTQPVNTKYGEILLSKISLYKNNDKLEVSNIPFNQDDPNIRINILNPKEFEELISSVESVLDENSVTKLTNVLMTMWMLIKYDKVLSEEIKTYAEKLPSISKIYQNKNDRNNVLVILTNNQKTEMSLEAAYTKKIMESINKNDVLIGNVYRYGNITKLMDAYFKELVESKEIVSCTDKEYQAYRKSFLNKREY